MREQVQALRTLLEGEAEDGFAASFMKYAKVKYAFDKADKVNLEALRDIARLHHIEIPDRHWNEAGTLVFWLQDFIANLWGRMVDIAVRTYRRPWDELGPVLTAVCAAAPDAKFAETWAKGEIQKRLDAPHTLVAAAPWRASASETTR